MGAQVIEQQEPKRSNALTHEGSVSKLNDWWTEIGIPTPNLFVAF